MKPNVDAMIENLVDATLGQDAPVREKHVFKESLRALVRFAKTEQLLEIRSSVRKLTGAVTVSAGRRKVKVDALLRQGQLELNAGEHIPLASPCAKNPPK